MKKILISFIVIAMISLLTNCVTSTYKPTAQSVRRISFFEAMYATNSTKSAVSGRGRICYRGESDVWGRIDCGFDSHYSEGGIEFHKQKTQESFSCSYESINPEVLAAKGLYFEWVKYISEFW